MNIEEVRQQYPQYKDMSDSQLADALHTKFYSDMPKDQFYAKVGVKAERPAATTGERAQAGLGGVNRGIAGLAGLPMDTSENIINLGLAGVGSVANLAGRPDLAPDLVKGTPGGSEWIAGQMNRGGIQTNNPRPDDQASRMLHTAGVIAGGSLVPGARPAPTAAAVAGGTVAGEALGPEWTGVGAMAPAGAVQAGQAAKGFVADRIRPNLETFKEAGTSPTVGQATESNFIRGLENLIAKFPGGVGVMRNFADKQQAEMGARNRTGVSAEDAGRAIETGVKGDGGFVERFKATQTKLYDRLDQYIQHDTSINVSKTKTALADLNADIPGAPNLSEWFKNAKIQGIEGAFKADTSGAAAANSSMPIFQLGMLKTLPLSAADKNSIINAFDKGELPYEAVKKLRTLVGKELSDSTIASSVPRSKWKALYAALSEDLGVAAQEKGVRAEEAWKLANNYTSAGISRIENVLDRVLGKTPEETFSRFMPKDAEQANKVRAVMRSLDPSQRSIVSEAVVSRLGRALPGKQNEAGDVFSSETFLTNWNKLSPGAKAQLFPNETQRGNLDSLASVSSNLREGSKTFANPSGTAGVAAPYGLGAMVATGNVAPAAGMIGSAYIGAKMLTNPKVVEWLAQAPKMRPEGMAAHLSRLGVIYNQSSDESLKAELSQFINQAGQK